MLEVTDIFDQASFLVKRPCPHGRMRTKFPWGTSRTRPPLEVDELPLDLAQLFLEL